LSSRALAVVIGVAADTDEDGKLLAWVAVVQHIDGKSKRAVPHACSAAGKGQWGGGSNWTFVNITGFIITSVLFLY
jgi:hypothetical protein